MSVVTAAIVGGAVVGAAGKAYAGKKQADSIKDQNDMQLLIARERNAFNREIFDESRGSKGSALLPLYADTVYGTPFEPQQFRDTREVYDLFAGSPEDDIARFQEVGQPLQVANRLAAGTTQDLFSGGLLDEELQANEPVQSARLRGVAARRQAGLESLEKTLNEIDAIQSGKGFVGDSSANRRLSFNARRDINTQSATDLAAVGEQGAIEDRNVRLNDINRRVANVGLPAAQINNALLVENAPENALIRQQGLRNSLFDPFRIGPGQAPQAVNPGPLQAVPSTGQIVGQTVGELGGSLGNLFANYQVAQQIGGAGGGAGSIGGGSHPFTSSYLSQTPTAGTNGLLTTGI